MDLIPIRNKLDENDGLRHDPFCAESLLQVIEFYRRIGFTEPWICYFARENDRFVGNAGFKGKPINGAVEIAYGTFEPFRGKGVATRICGKLVDLALATDASLKITARTLPEHNYSTRILERNSFRFDGAVKDLEDGEVWEWVYVGGSFAGTDSTNNNEER